METGAEQFSQDATAKAGDTVQAQIDRIHSQMALYARDLKRMVDAERQKARALAEANARLAILDRLKTDFLAFIAHELRTPLSGMLVLDLLDPHGDPQSLTEMIDILRHGYERLEKFIERGLEYFKWLAAEPRTDQATVSDLTAVTQTTLDAMQELRNPAVTLERDMPQEPCFVRGENEHLARVVEILIDNALKFSEDDKHIHVSVKTETGRATLTVSDHGRGFAPEMGSELLRPFTIANVLNHSQGTGLSLALASAIVAASGGKISAASAGVGQGATFTVELPTVLLL
jgi:signal transduction histidine kinase